MTQIMHLKAKTQQHTNATHSHPFALSIDTNTHDMSSHYSIIKNECIALRQSMKQLQLRMKSEYHLKNMKQKTQHKERLRTLQQLSQRKKEVMAECELISQNIEHEQHDIERIGDDQEELLLKKIALQQNVSECRNQLDMIRSE
eukprot:420378_1